MDAPNAKLISRELVSVLVLFSLFCVFFFGLSFDYVIFYVVSSSKPFSSLCFASMYIFQLSFERWACGGYKYSLFLFFPFFC